ncbi:hemerythrin domain-containing protein [Marinitenerispora sediminis]|nr:hemerythrin domain-containing protein [Marinitenerispora sediminis]
MDPELGPAHRRTEQGQRHHPRPGAAPHPPLTRRRAPAPRTGPRGAARRSHAWRRPERAAGEHTGHARTGRRRADITDDALAPIRADNGELAAALTRLGRDRPARPELLDDLAARVVAHLCAAESELDRVLAREAAEPGILHRRNAARRHIEQLLSRLKAVDPAGRRFAELLRRLTADLRAHLAEEEEIVLPDLRSAVGPERLAELGAAFERRRRAEFAHLRPG